MYVGMEVGNRKDNGERLVDFCVMNNLVIGGILFMYWDVSWNWFEMF